jgi:hypothetical protein
MLTRLFFAIWLLAGFGIAAQFSETTQTLSERNIPFTDDELNLMYLAFIYDQQLDKAYKVTSIALKRHPQSRQWHERAATVAQWTGRADAALKHFFYLYRYNPSPKMAEKIVNYALESYQYDTAYPYIRDEFIHHPDANTTKDYVYVSEQSGRVDEAIQTLLQVHEKHPALTAPLVRALRLSNQSGQLETSRSIIETLTPDERTDPEIAPYIADYYYLNREPDRALEVLTARDPNSLPDTTLMTISDLGWMTGNYEQAAAAARLLMMRSHARAQDLERITLYYHGKQDAIAAAAAYRAWEQQRKPYLFLNFAYLSLQQNDLQPLQNAIAQIDANASLASALETPPYFLIKAELYQRTSQPDAAVAALEHARTLAPESAEITASLLWFYMDHKYPDKLYALLVDLENRSPVDPKLWMPMASGYYQLQASDRALYYLQKIRGSGQENIDIEFLYAYILQSQNETDAALGQMNRIFNTLEVQRKTNPELMQDPVFVDRYLKSAMYVLNPDKFVQLMHKAESVLDRQHYSDIELFWALRNREPEQANFILTRLGTTEPWMRLARDLHFGALDDLQELLYREYRFLPIRDRVEGALQTGDRAFAATLAFKGLQENTKDELLYYQYLQLIEEESDTLDAQLAFIRRSSLGSTGMHASNRSRLKRGWTVYVDADLFRNRIENDKYLASVPATLFRLDGAIGRRFDRGTATVLAGYRHAMRDYVTAHLTGEWRATSRWRLTGEAGWKRDSEETLYTLLGGYKNLLGLQADYALMPSTSIVLDMAYNDFFAQDDTRLGSGTLLRAQYRTQWRSGHPALASALFYEMGRYRETDGSRGVIDSLMKTPTKALPEDFDNLGLSLQYGMTTATRYTRVWRGFFEIIPMYNSTLGDFSYLLNAGGGGLLTHQDHLTFGLNYNQALNGTNEFYLKAYLNYRFYY